MQVIYLHYNIQKDTLIKHYLRKQEEKTFINKFDMYNRGACNYAEVFYKNAKAPVPCSETFVPTKSFLKGFLLFRNIAALGIQTFSRRQCLPSGDFTSAAILYFPAAV